MPSRKTLVLPVLAAAGALAALGVFLGRHLQEEIAIRRLRSPLEEDRFAAAELLGRRGVARAVPALLRAAAETEALDDDFRRLPDAVDAPEHPCSSALRRVLGPKSVPHLLEALRDPKPGTRLVAIKALETLGPQGDDALQALGEALLDPELSEAAAGALLSYGRRAAPAFGRALLERRVMSQGLSSIMGLWSIRDLGPVGKALLPDLRGYPIHSADSDYVFGLLQAADAGAFAHLARRLARPGPKVVARGLWLGHEWCDLDPRSLHVHAAAPVLEELLESPVEVMRAVAAVALGELGDPCRPMVLQALAEAMKMEPEIQVRAAAVLGRCLACVEEAVPLILDTLRSEERPVQDAAASALKALCEAGEPLLDAWLAAIPGKDPAEEEEEEERALRALARAFPGKESVVSAVLRAARSRSSLEHDLLEAMGWIAPEGRAFLVPLERVTGRKALLAAAFARARHDPLDVASQAVLIQALDNEKDQAFALEALTHVGPIDDDGLAVALAGQAARGWGEHLRLLGAVRRPLRRVFPALLETLRSRGEKLHEHAMEVLARLQPERDEAPLLEALLEDRDPEVAAWAAFSLEKLGAGARASAPALRRALARPETGVRAHAAMALLAQGDTCEDVVEVLLQVLEEAGYCYCPPGVGVGFTPGREYLGEAVAVSLRRAPGALLKAGRRLAARLPALQGDGLRDALHTIGRLGCAVPGALDRALELLRNTPGSERLLLLCILRLQEPGPALVAALMGCLRSSRDNERAVALDGLGSLGPVATPAVPALIDELRERRDARRAAKALAGIGASAVPALVQALRDPDPDTRSWVAFTLAALGEPARPAVPALAARLEDPDEFVRMNAAEALGHLGPIAREAAGALRGRLEDPSPEVRLHVGAAIRTVESAWSVSSQPAALKYLEDTNSWLQLAPSTHPFHDRLHCPRRWGAEPAVDSPTASPPASPSPSG